jgi:hypothetical protein
MIGPVAAGSAWRPSRHPWRCTFAIAGGTIVIAIVAVILVLNLSADSGLVIAGSPRSVRSARFNRRSNSGYV